MADFTTKGYCREIDRIKRQLEALKPAAQYLGIETGLRRAINGVHEAKLDAMGI